MRFVLVLLAVMGLLASPAAAAAAQAACHDHGGQTMMDMPMSGMSGMAQADDQKADPCCDPGKDRGPNQARRYELPSGLRSDVRHCRRPPVRHVDSAGPGRPCGAETRARGLAQAA